MKAYGNLGPCYVVKAIQAAADNAAEAIGYRIPSRIVAGLRSGRRARQQGSRCWYCGFEKKCPLH